MNEVWRKISTLAAAGRTRALPGSDGRNKSIHISALLAYWQVASVRSLGSNSCIASSHSVEKSDVSC